MENLSREFPSPPLPPQEHQTTQVPAGLRALKNASPRLRHFNLDVPTASPSVAVGGRIFCPATWNDQNVTLCITFDLAVPTPRRDFYLSPIIEFVDTAPREIVDKVRPSVNEDVEGDWRDIYIYFFF